MSDLVLLEAIKTLFWLLVFGVSVWVFRNEAKQLLQSLTGFKFAGATFELKDKKETVRCYILLAETLVDILSRGNGIDELQRVLDQTQVEKLGSFALKYTKEMPEGDWNEELLKNIAYLLLRVGRYKQSLDLYDRLLVRRPDHFELLNLKALALMTTRLEKNVKAAEEILTSIVGRYPEIPYIRANLALTLSLLKKDVDAAREMRRAIDDGFWRSNPDALADPLFQHVRENSPDLFNSLNQHLFQLKQGRL